jgi:hypothetical protein
VVLRGGLVSWVWGGGAPPPPPPLEFGGFRTESIGFQR